MSAEQLNDSIYRYDFNNLSYDTAELQAILSESRGESDDLAKYINNLNDLYSPISDHGIVVALETAAACLWASSDIQYLTNDGSNICVKRLVETPNSFMAPSIIVNEIGCFDGFDILTFPNGNQGVYLRCNKGGLLHWSKIEA
jgi:hypothetical protein